MRNITAINYELMPAAVLLLKVQSNHRLLLLFLVFILIFGIEANNTLNNCLGSKPVDENKKNQIFPLVV